MIATQKLLAAMALLSIAAGMTASAQKKKEKKEEITQTLALPKDPPAAAVGDARRLVFHVSPLSGKGLLAQQTRDAVQAILRENGGAQIIHLRAFVAGNGDIRRVGQIASEVISKKIPLPSISVMQVGRLGLENAQVVLEAVSLARKDVNPSGVQFVAGELVTGADPASSPVSQLNQALAGLAGKLGGATPLAVTCYVSNLGDAASLTHEVSTKFTGAAVNLVQTQRGPFQAFAACEAAARAVRPGSPKIAFSGTRTAFGTEEKDVALALQRLDRDLTEAGADAAHPLLTHIYPVSQKAAELAQKTRGTSAPVMTIPVERVAALDAGVALDAIAAAN
jgi:hypothetical protein